MFKKLLLISFAMLLTTMLFAACQSQSKPAAQPAPTNTSAPAPTNTVAPAPTNTPAPTPTPAITPAVSVEDQTITGGKVVIAKVVSPGPGWIVIHAQKDGKPGPILGFAPVQQGENENVAVEIDAAKATDTLYAMLHTDAGEMGKFEFPGPDAPVKVGDKIVTPSFQATQPMTPAVSVEDQTITGGKVVIAKVVSPGPGWIVIHAQKDGKPGPILGFAPVQQGENENVAVEIDAAKATDTLYAMLHTDAGEMGKFEFPGPDAPVKVDGKVITPPFRVNGDAKVSKHETLGDILVDRNGMTLYVFLKDQPGKSNCYGQCAQNWPPLLVDGDPVAGPGVNPDLLGVTKRDDGSMQVTYNQLPLYFFISDKEPGDTYGQGINDIWYVIGPDGDIITQK